MDKIVLTHGQLQQLVSYIHARGFRDPAVVAEILDHFACKVEERLNADWSLSLERAMEKAHNDFGVSGFRPLVAAYELQVRKKYKAVYNAEVKKTLQHAPLMLTAILAGAAVCKGFLWAEAHGLQHILAINDVAWLTAILILAAWAIAMRRLYRKPFFESILATVSRSEYNWILASCAGFLVPARNQHSVWQVQLLAAAYALATVMVIVTFHARYRTVKKAFTEFEAVQQAVAS